MRIAVTGANGFVGSTLLRYLESKGHAVRAIVRKGSNLTLLQDLPVVYADYDNHLSLVEAMKGVDVLVHNAGLTKGLSYNDFYQANVVLTDKVLRAAVAVNTIQRFVYISSQAASRPSKSSIPVTEEDSPSPVTWYGKSKLRAEELIAKKATIPYSIVRPCSIYGPGDKDFLQLFKLLQRGLDIQLGNKDRYLNMIHVEELASFIELVCVNPKAAGEIFFASDGQVYKQSEISRMMLLALGRQAISIKIPDLFAKAVFSMGDIVSKLLGKAMVINSQKGKEALAEGWLCSIEKAMALLGYHPQPDLQKRLEETLKWYKDSSWL